MQKLSKKLQYLDCEIKKISEIKDYEIYFHEQDEWNIKGEKISSDNDWPITTLNKKPKINYLKVEIEKGEWRSVFWLEKYKISIIAKIRPKTHEATLKKLLKEMENCLEHAKQNFHANHDTLTGLFNRNGAQIEFSKNSQDLIEKENPIEDGEQKIKLLESIAIFSFDIDNFKQINDTYGHQAGDAVLAIFAKRLDFSVKKLEATMDSKFILSRPGGEEFELIATENLTRNILEEIGNTLLQEIRQPSISTEIEIKEYEKNNKIEVSKNIFETKILASIGISNKTLSGKKSEINEVISELRQSADTALYRAKNDGKDCIRFFDDIRIKHGRVAEFHSHSDLAIIDIGKSVHVKNGDIYSVYYTPFTGEDSCIRDDGRSKKKLGEYIAVESAKIQVVHVQDQLSTCVVIEKHTSYPIPIGSLLKRLNVGTTPRFFSSRQFQTSNGKPEDLIKRINSLINENNLLSIINLLPTIDTEDFDAKSRLLLQYSSYISMVLPIRTEVFLSADDSMYIIIKNGSYYFEEDEYEEEDEAIRENFSLEMKRQIDATLGNLSKYFKFHAGIYLSCDHPNFSDKTPEICLHLSKAALHVSQSKITKKNITYFDSHRTIFAWRREQGTKDAIADYCSFKKYGIIDVGMENQLGLSILISEDISNFELAELAFSIANEADPAHGFFGANLGLIKAYMGKYSEAYQLLSKIKDINSDTTYSAPYRISLAKSALECQKSGEDLNNDELLELINWTTDNSIEKTIPSNYRRWLAELEKQKEVLISKTKQPKQKPPIK
ncbi:diguanylate cyclase [Janthinobacterium sp. PSPC2-1]|uniref:diguanylate cyclase n=1 Tax=unclassified Janthinobacterium TaxID=2610881 RepID=UPI003CE72E8A